jgi:predicted CXXCH cytochrome family protein
VNIKPDAKKHVNPMKKEDKNVEFVTCESCHVAHDGKLGSALLDKKYATQDALCETCHDKQSAKNKEESRHKGIHPVNVKPDSPMKQHDKEVKLVTCQSCHNVHSGTPDTALLDKGIKEAEALCQTCHTRQHAKDKQEAQRKGVHPMNVKLDETVEIVAGKKTREIGCLTCHSVHDGKPDTAALVETDKEGQLCSHCHQGKQAVVGSDHDLRITAKNKTNRFGEKPTKIGVCGSCHTLHKGDNNPPHLSSVTSVIEDFADHELQHSTLREDKLCINCHQNQGMAEKKVVKYFTHPNKDMVLRSDKKIMPLLNKKEEIDDIGEIACKTCHDPHFWSANIQAKALKSTPTSILSLGQTENVEGTPLNSFLRTEGVKNTFCVECHGINALPKFKYFHDKNTVRQIGVDYLK